MKHSNVKQNYYCSHINQHAKAVIPANIDNIKNNIAGIRININLNITAIRQNGIIISLAKNFGINNKHKMNLSQQSAY